MLSRNLGLLTISKLKDAKPASFYWLDKEEIAELAGRCLLDAIEYLRAIPPFPAEFRQVTNAHAVRLVCGCLSDLKCDKLLERLKPSIASTCEQLLLASSKKPPSYGDDFWDWAMVLWALEETHRCLPGVGELSNEVIAREVRQFFEEVEKKIDKGLTIPSNKEKEWYGPATAAAAYQLIERHRTHLGASVDQVLAKLKKQALEVIKKGKYRTRSVEPYQQLWHYGQVVAVFKSEAKAQAKAIADFKPLKNLDKTKRVYALARILQGAFRIDPKKTCDAALEALYRCEDQGRPLGQGLVGDNPKGSLNVLEALWPMLKKDNKGQVRTMVEALKSALLQANTVGIVVTIDNEERAIRDIFKEDRATIKEDKKEAGKIVFEHEDYRVIVCRDKGGIGAQEAAKRLIDTHEVSWLIMVGIAGSLADFVHEKDKPSKLVGRGADVGQAVVATALQPYQLYYKARAVIENAPVPFRGHQWTSIPTDPVLFSLAHIAGEELSKKFHEGPIVTGTAVVDDRDEKKKVLAEFPGGLAVETEGYIVGLICMLSGISYLVIRGISDCADGSKKALGKSDEQQNKDQYEATIAAGRLALGVVKQLSQRW